MRKFLFIVAVASSAVYFTPGKASAQVADTTRKTTPAVTPAPGTTAPADDVVRVLLSNVDYSSAAAAFKTVGLDTVLKTGGPYTIFAPNNNAFSKLPAGKLDSLSKDPAKLSAFL